MWQKVAKFKGAEYFRKALYLEHYIWPRPIGLWSKVVHYKGNRVLLGLDGTWGSKQVDNTSELAGNLYSDQTLEFWSEGEQWLVLSPPYMVVSVSRRVGHHLSSRERNSTTTGAISAGLERLCWLPGMQHPLKVVFKGFSCCSIDPSQACEDTCCAACPAGRITHKSREQTLLFPFSTAKALCRGFQCSRLFWPRCSALLCSVTRRCWVDL